MTDKIAVMGLVLSVMPVGEYDRRLVILTRERGKISAFAKGARRQNSPFLACSQPFVFGSFSLFQGRSSYTLAGAEIKNYFQELRGDVELTFYGMYFCEFADYMTSEGNDERAVLKLLYQSLRALTHEKFGPKLTRLIYEWKMFYLNGEGPEVFSCVSCNNGRKQGKKKSAQELTQQEAQSMKNCVFRIKAGGLVCGECAARAERRVPGDIDRSLSDGAWYTLRFLAVTPPEKLYTFQLADSAKNELAELVKDYRAEYLRHSFQSLELIESMPE